METRVALLAVIVREEESVAALNGLLHQYSGHGDSSIVGFWVGSHSSVVSVFAGAPPLRPAMSCSLRLSSDTVIMEATWSFFSFSTLMLFRQGDKKF